MREQYVRSQSTHRENNLVILREVSQHTAKIRRKSNQFICRSLINVMATFEENVKKIQIKFKILDLAVKENETIISRNKVNELVK